MSVTAVRITCLIITCYSRFNSVVTTMSADKPQSRVAHVEAAGPYDTTVKNEDSTIDRNDVDDETTEVVLDIRDAHLASGQNLKLAKDGRVRC